jgi:putative phage-type endonuclease
MPLSAADTVIRQRHVGASEVSALLGMHPRKSALDVWTRLIEGTEPIATEEEKQWMHDGQELEPAVMGMYARRKKIWKLDIEQPGTQTSTKWPHLCATPDGVIPKLNRLLEVKTAIWPGDEWGEEGSSDIPEHYKVQVQCTLAILGLDVADVAALLAGKLRLYTVRADPVHQKVLHEVVTDFWTKHIHTAKEPPPDGHVRYSEHLKKKFPQALSDSVFVATSEQDEAMKKYDEARAAIRHWGAIKDLAWQQLADAIGAAVGIAGDWGRASWGNVRGEMVVDWEAVAKDLNASEALIQRHTLEKAGHRQLRVTKSKTKVKAA